MRRLPWLSLRRLPSMSRLWRRLRLRSWLRILLRVLGRLPPLLSRRPACRHDRLTNIEMAGSDKVDPAIQCCPLRHICLLRHVCFRRPHANYPRAGRRGDDGFPGFQSFQKMLARELDMNVPAAYLPRWRFGVICKMRVLTS
ncbi:hypothetical protein [Bradyrhizobium sp.]|uniref:hypothetical protein n=1 Tax=Bradyrhizobium sp. TaxID=376 RepID=UPI003BB0D730